MPDIRKIASGLARHPRRYAKDVQLAGEHDMQIGKLQNVRQGRRSSVKMQRCGCELSNMYGAPDLLEEQRLHFIVSPEGSRASDAGIFNERCTRGEALVRNATRPPDLTMLRWLVVAEDVGWVTSDVWRLGRNIEARKLGIFRAINASPKLGTPCLLQQPRRQKRAWHHLVDWDCCGADGDFLHAHPRHALVLAASGTLPRSRTRCRTRRTSCRATSPPATTRT